MFGKTFAGLSRVVDAKPPHSVLTEALSTANEPQSLPVPLGAVERGHGVRAPAGGELPVEDRAMPEDRQPVGQPPEAALEAVAA
jgi:hypothetical protein